MCNSFFKLSINILTLICLICIVSCEAPKNDLNLSGSWTVTANGHPVLLIITDKEGVLSGNFNSINNPRNVSTIKGERTGNQIKFQRLVNQKPIQMYNGTINIVDGIKSLSGKFNVVSKPKIYNWMAKQKL